METEKDMNIQLAFSEPKSENLLTVNQVLNGLEVTDLTIADVKGSFVTIENYHKDETVPYSVEYTFFMESIILEGTRDETQETYTYQLYVEAVPHEKVLSFNEFYENWRKEHPDQIIRLQRMHSFEENGFVFFILHHKSEK